MVEVFRADVLGGIPHGFLGRRGGVSTGAANRASGVVVVAVAVSTS